MEYGLGHAIIEVEDSVATTVLILVLMEYGLGQAQRTD